MRKIIGFCPMPNCGKTIHCRGFCRSHYRKLFGENKKRWLKVKSDPVLLSKVRKLNLEYKKTDDYKDNRKVHDHAYYLKNKKSLLLYRKHWNEINRFGTFRQVVLNRDGNKCTLSEKYPLWNHTKDLIIHHINGKGRCTDNPDNNPKNLVTLCRSCHMKIHGPYGLVEL